MSAVDLHLVRQMHGGTVYDGGRRWLGPGPGHGRRDASLSVLITATGRAVVHSFAKDNFKDCLAHLGLDNSEAEKIDRFTLARLNRQRAAEDRARREAAMAHCAAVWKETRDGEGSPVEAYLASRRIEGPVPSTLRFHPSAPLDYQAARRTPAMVGLVQSADGASLGLHVTTLAGRRAKLMFGQTRGGAVRLSDFAGGDLAVAEGIETALSFSAMNQVPTWACLSTSGLQAFALPTGVRRLIIAADRDDGGAGMESARLLANRVRSACDVVIVPAPEGQDWNDFHRQQGGRA